MTPKWFQLIRAQQLCGRAALTIPFLIGASRERLSSAPMPLDTARRETAAILNSFLDETPATHAVSIYRCPDICQPVATHFYSAYSVPKAQAFESQSQRRPTLYIAPELFRHRALTLADLAKQLFQELHPVLCAGQFSFLANTYATFTADDLKFIQFSTSI